MSEPSQAPDRSFTVISGTWLAHLRSPLGWRDGAVEPPRLVIRHRPDTRPAWRPEDTVLDVPLAEVTPATVRRALRGAPDDFSEAVQAAIGRLHEAGLTRFVPASRLPTPVPNGHDIQAWRRKWMR
jgi:hypothetical protein